MRTVIAKSATAHRTLLMRNPENRVQKVEEDYVQEQMHAAIDASALNAFIIFKEAAAAIYCTSFTQ